MDIEKLTLEQALERHKEGTLVGVFLMSNDDYHRSPGISKSTLDKVHVSPATYRHTILNPEPPTSAMEFGSALHTGILEPGEFDKRYAIAGPELDRRGTKAWQAFEAENPGKVLLKDEEGSKIEQMIKVARKHSRATLLDGMKEIAFFCKHPETGLVLKCKVDVLTAKGVITDYKASAMSVYPERRWASVCYRLRYHVGAAFYLDVVLHALDQSGKNGMFPKIPSAFVLFAQEKDAPFLVKPWAVGEQSILLGRREYEADLKLIKECDEKQAWPGYPEKIEVVELPEYAWKDELEEVGNE